MTYIGDSGVSAETDSNALPVSEAPGPDKRSQIGWTKHHWKIAAAEPANTVNERATSNVWVQDYHGGSHFGQGGMI